MATWNVQYEANELPAEATPVWEKNVLSPGPTESVDSGILTLNANYAASDDDRTSIYYSIAGPGTNSSGITIEFKVKVITFGLETDDYYVLNDAVWLPMNCYMEFTDTNNWIIASIRDGQVTLYYNRNSDSYAMDPTDGYHTYRMTLLDGTATLYVDGVQRIQVTGNLGDDGGGNFIDWGNYSNNRHRTGIDEANWDYVYYNVNSAIPVTTTTTTSSTTSSTTTTSTSTSSTTTVAPSDTPGGDIILEKPPYGEVYDLS